MTEISNDWVIPVDKDNNQVLRNGVTVKRKFAGLDTTIDINNVVDGCTVKYWEREYYPNGEVIKTELKTYTLQDLAETTGTDETGDWVQDALPVLQGFIYNLGYPGIINPARETLGNAFILPLTIANNYPLRRDTRPKNYIVLPEEPIEP